MGRETRGYCEGVNIWSVAHGRFDKVIIAYSGDWWEALLGSVLMDRGG